MQTMENFQNENREKAGKEESAELGLAGAVELLNEQVAVLLSHRKKALGNTAGHSLYFAKRFNL